MNTENYTKGFNSGYLISKYRADIADGLFTTIMYSSEFLEGLYDGRAQYVHERLSQPLSLLQQLREQSSERNNELEQ